VQLEKPALGLATLDLVMSRAEIKHRGSAGVHSGHGLLVGNDGMAHRQTWRGSMRDGGAAARRSAR
jgi:hypothetical protein